MPGEKQMAEKAGSIYFEVDAELSGLLDAQRKANKTLDSIGNSATNASTKISGLVTGISRLAGAIAASVIIEFGKNFLQAADAVSQLQARITRLSPDLVAANQTFGELADIASKTGAGLRDTTKLWETLTSSLKESGATNAQVLNLTQTLQKIGRIGGSSAEEMANALRQFGQSISGGVVRAEEFNSILEQMPELARQIAKGMGVSIGQLRQLMLAGKLSAEDALNAIQRRTEDVNSEFDKLPRTLDQATGSLSISFAKLTASVNEATGASHLAVEVIDRLSGFVAKLGDNSTSTAEKFLSMAAAISKITPSISGATVVNWLWPDDGQKKQKEYDDLVNDFIKSSQNGYEQAKKNAEGRKEISLAGADADSKATEKLVQNSARRLALSKLEGEARARLQAKYDAADAGIKDPEKVKELQDQYAATYRNVQAQKESNKESKSSASSAESVAQKLANLRQQSELAADSTRELSREQAILKAQQSLGKAATQDQIKLAGEYAAKTWDVANALKMRQEAEQATRFVNQEVSAAKVQRDPYTGEAVDPYAQVNEEESRKLEALRKYQQLGAVDAQQYEDGKTAIMQQAANERINIAQDESRRQVDVMNTLLGGLGDSFSGLADIISKSSGDTSDAYRVLFGIGKGFAVAQAGLNLQLALSNAMASGPFPWNLSAMASVAAAGGSLISSIAGATYGGARKNGGPVSAGEMYRVGEGGMPEIYQASSGRQYMIPGDNGKVISNKDMQGDGGGGASFNPVMNLTINTTGGVGEEDISRLRKVWNNDMMKMMVDQSRRPGGILAPRK
jgi:tape measure domain-containing protein